MTEKHFYTPVTPPPLLLLLQSNFPSLVPLLHFYISHHHPINPSQHINYHLNHSYIWSLIVFLARSWQYITTIYTLYFTNTLTTREASLRLVPPYYRFRPQTPCGYWYQNYINRAFFPLSDGDIDITTHITHHNNHSL